MKYIAHLREDGKEQPLSEHLNNVAAIAAQFAEPFGAGRQAYSVGLLHDMGKYGKTSQEHMQHPDTTSPCDHSTAGAQRAFLMGDIFGSLAIAGHHAGIPDLGERGDTADDSTLMGRRKRTVEDVSAWDAENKLPDAEEKIGLPQWLDYKNPYAPAFYTRMIYSCLVDADFLDTEQFMRGEPAVRGDFPSLDKIRRRFIKETSPWLEHAEGDLNQCRSNFLRRCLDAGKRPTGFYSLTIPTGGGKTASSLAFALNHAIQHNLRRVIYVIPYTSIIEQNANVFRQLTGKESVLEHHSQFDCDSGTKEEADRWSLAAENWDAPLIVTTSVQFFESLHAFRPSRCRKLHNIAESVIILDEAQMLPLHLLRACTAALTELTLHYHSTVVLCTATQPALNEVIQEFAPDIQVRELIPSECWPKEVFRRNRIEWKGLQSLDKIADKMSLEAQCLCIVNYRSEARELFQKLPPEGRYHLSTMMTPENREKVLNAIRSRLREGLPCRVVSTSLIECGVDVDFPAVWREEAGLDSILQAAGRCNREGKHAASESIVYIFTSEKGTPAQIRMQCEALLEVRRNHEENIADEPSITAYFKQLRYLMGKDRMDQHNILSLCQKLSFREITSSFKMINSNTVSVYIETDDNRSLVNQLRYGMITKELLRKLSRSAVPVYLHQLSELSGTSIEQIQAGNHQVIHGKYVDIIDGQVAVLTNPLLYNEETGLQVECCTGMGLFE